MALKENKRLLFILFSALIFNSFFVNKAFHIDDPFTINIARAVASDFIRVQEVFFSNPIFLGYYYAPVIKIFGESELLMHIFYMPFTLLSIVAMYLLSLRFAGRSLIPTLMMVVTPAFVVMSQGIMLDIPMLGFYLSSLAAFIYGVDKGEKKLLLLSGILGGMAILTKYTALLVIPIMLVYLILFSKRRSHFIFIVIPVTIFCLWALHNLFFYNNFPLYYAFLFRMKNCSFEQIMFRVFACLSFISGASVIGLLSFPLLLGKRKNIVLLLLSLCAGLCPFAAGGLFREYGVLEKSALALFFIASFFIICFITKKLFESVFKKPRDRDSAFLCVWFILSLISIILTQFISARFVMLLFPPMFILIYRSIKEIWEDRAWVLKLALPACLCAAFAVSIVVAIGDYQLAGLYRDFVKRIDGYGLKKKEIYFCPNAYSMTLAWGYAYYLDSQYPEGGQWNESGKYSLAILPARKVLPITIQGLCPLPRQAAGAGQKEAGRYLYSGYVLVHSRENRVGFYSHDWGLLPFKFSPGKRALEEFIIYDLSGH